MPKVILFISSILLISLLSVSCEKKDTSRMIVDGKLEPAEPNESLNDSTLLGVDSNGDGVRDDVERWINEKGESRSTRQCLKIIAMNLTNGIINYRDKELAYKFNATINDAKACLYKIYGVNYRDVGPLTKSLYAQIINNNERSKAYSLMDRSLGGEAFPINTINPCETIGVDYE